MERVLEQDHFAAIHVGATQNIHLFAKSDRNISAIQVQVHVNLPVIDYPGKVLEMVEVDWRGQLVFSSARGSLAFIYNMEITLTAEWICPLHKNCPMPIIAVERLDERAIERQI